MYTCIYVLIVELWVYIHLLNLYKIFLAINLFQVINLLKVIKIIEKI